MSEAARGREKQVRKIFAGVLGQYQWEAVQVRGSAAIWRTIYGSCWMIIAADELAPSLSKKLGTFGAVAATYASLLEAWSSRARHVDVLIIGVSSAPVTYKHLHRFCAEKAILIILESECALDAPDIDAALRDGPLQLVCGPTSCKPLADMVARGCSSILLWD